MNTIKLLRNLSVRFPKSIKSRGDRVGLMSGKLPEEVNNILLCLDFDDTVYVYDGEICEYISRLDNGEYDITTGEVPQANKIRFDSELSKDNNKY